MKAMDYSSDKPIENSDNDRYSRKNYAKKVAEVLKDASLKDDFVIGLYSKWGYGKSSVLAMVKEYVGDDAILIPFNPWIFENQTAIVTSLLFNLAEKLDETIAEETGEAQKKTWLKKRIDKQTRNGSLTTSDTAVRLINKYSGLVGIGLNLASGNAAAGKASDAIFTLAETYMKTSSIEDIKKRIEEKIEQAGKKIIITIDDLDRLDKDEIFQLLKIVKIIADFKGVTYLVAFDDEAVAAAIAERYSPAGDKETGRAFLEKIIQIPLHLPAIPQRLLDKEVFIGIDKLLKENGLEITDEEVSDFRSVYDSDIAPSVDSPRSVTRYLNSLKFTIPFVGKEVNMSDFLLIEALRIFHPFEYEKLRHEKEVLTGVSSTFRFTLEEEDTLTFKENAQKLTSSNREVLEITKALFPAFSKKLDHTNSHVSMKELRKERRVASTDYFDRYFSYGVVNDDVSDTVIIGILSESTSEIIAAGLKKILQEKNQELVFTKIDSYKHLTQEPLELSKAIISLVDFIELGEGGFTSSPLEMSADILGEILTQSGNKLDFSKKLIDFTNDPTMLFYIIREVVSNSKPESYNRVLNDTELDEFQTYIVNKIRDLNAASPILKRESEVAYYLFAYWAEYGDKSEVEAALKLQLKTADEVLRYATLHLSKISGGGRRHRGNFHNGAYGSLTKTVSADYVVKILAEKYPQLAKNPSFKDIERDDTRIGDVGNENTELFRERIAEQIMYQHKKYNEHKAEDAE